jgi:hypothetical protein
MAVRLRYKMYAAVSSSSAEENDLGKVQSEVCVDDLNEGGAWKTTVVAAAVAVSLPLDSIASAKFLAVKVSPKDPTQTMTQVDLILNGATTLQLFPAGAAKEAHFIVSSAGITSLAVTNNQAGAVAVDVVIAVAGD